MQHTVDLADNGSNWYFAELPIRRGRQPWSTSSSRCRRARSKAVDESSLMISPDSGQARQTGSRRCLLAGPGYRMAAADGGVFSFCEPFHGSMGGAHLNRPIVGMASTPDGGATGWWPPTAASSASGTAAFHGSMGGAHLNRRSSAWRRPPMGWLLAGGLRRRHLQLRGRRLPRLDGGAHLNRPIVGMASTPDGGGYWLVASDGGIFSFGTPPSTARWRRPPQPADRRHGVDRRWGGYWLVASDGGIFSFGDAAFDGSMGGAPSTGRSSAWAAEQPRRARARSRLGDDTNNGRS